MKSKKTAIKPGWAIIFGLVFIVTSCNFDEPTDDSPKVWKMENGLLVVEVESVENGATTEGIWQPVGDSLTGYTGDAAFIMTSWGNMYKDPLVHDAPQTSNGYRLRYHILADEPGEYLLKIRNYHQLPDGDNDIWLSINENLYQKAWDHDSLKWNWNEATANISSYQPFELEHGINTIDIVGRSKGFAIDRFTVYKKETPKEVWENTENPESSLVKPESKDRIPPSVPQNLKSTDKGTGYVLLEWLESSDNHQVYAYQVFVNGDKQKTVFRPESVIDNLEPDQEYELSVKAMDFSGNVSETSEIIKVKTLTFEQVDGINIPYAANRPEIDGIEDEVYNKSTPVVLSNSEEQANESPDIYGTFKTLWDSTYLYVFASVSDDNLNTGTFDGIEILIDTDNSKSETLSYNDRHYRFFLNRPKENGKHHFLTAKINRDDFIKNVLEERILDEKSYQIEVALPWKTLGAEPAANQLIGLNFLVRDYDENPDETDDLLSWSSKSGYSQINPIVFGTAKLTIE